MGQLVTRAAARRRPLALVPPAEPAHRCRLCSANDRDALVEDLAAAMWRERRRDDRFDDTAWEDAGPYWQAAWRKVAEQAVRALEGVTGSL